ncbi:MAG: PEP-CTERM/exosortase system-associated acyltransferase [Desulfobulbus sp.]|nr:PEP-CTERM/exosortase system-associated acyltransferase [Desulfobulbus sp.]
MQSNGMAAEKRQERRTMSHNAPSTPCNILQASSTPAESGQKDQDGKFHFPGSLSLHAKRLIKGENIQDYDAMHRLRYQVFCNEVHFLDPDHYPAGLEIDDFDAVSEHFLATSASTNDDVIGTVRLVRWSERHSFPTARHFGSLLQHLDNFGFPLHSTAEISRLCISKQYRKRLKDGLLGLDGYEESGDRRRRYPEVILELFKVMYLASRFDLGITHWIATFEDSLYRLLNRYGIHLELLSTEEIDYYGKVKIYGASIPQILEAMKMQRYEFYTFFCEPCARH